MDRLTAKLVNRLTAKLVNRLITKLMNRLTAKLVDRLTTKLVVVNLVKLHLTKLIRGRDVTNGQEPGISPDECERDIQQLSWETNENSTKNFLSVQLHVLLIAYSVLYIQLSNLKS